MLTPAESNLTIFIISRMQKHSKEHIWRENGNDHTTKNSPSNIL